MNRLVAISLATLVGACATTPPLPTYHASGSDPTWNLQIDDRLTFTSGDVAANEPTPPMIRGFARGNLEYYQTRRIEVNVAHYACTDGGNTYPDQVQVVVDGHRYYGCGGA